MRSCVIVLNRANGNCMMKVLLGSRNCVDFGMTTLTAIKILELLQFSLMTATSS